MKIIYEYGFMFVIHTTGHVDTYDKNSVEAQIIEQQKARDDADKDIKTLEEHLAELTKSAIIVATEVEKESWLTRAIRRLRNAVR